MEAQEGLPDLKYLSLVHNNLSRFQTPGRIFPKLRYLNLVANPLQPGSIDVKELFHLEVLVLDTPNCAQYPLAEFTGTEKQEKIELQGEVIYGEPDHIGRKQKQVNISLRRPLKQS